MVLLPQACNIGFEQGGKSFPVEDQTKLYFTSLALSLFGMKNNHSFCPSKYLTGPRVMKDRLTRENQPEVYLFICSQRFYLFT